MPLEGDTDGGTRGTHSRWHSPFWNVKRIPAPEKDRVLNTLPVFKLWDSLTAPLAPQGEKAPEGKVPTLPLLGLSSMGPWGLWEAG